MILRKFALMFSVPLLAAGCARGGDIVEGGITAVRSACPQVSIPASTGDITLFDPANSRDARAIDVVAVLTNVRHECNESAGEQVVTNVTFDVLARRRDTAQARSVTLPYFVVMLQGGSAVVAKRVGQVTLNFAAGQERAQASGQGSTAVTRTAATLPAEVRRQLAERRRPGQEAAAVDPLGRPEVRQAVLRATFETLIGFQITDEQLRYNATR